MRQMRTDDSSNVAAVSWNSGKMEVEFTSGAVYRYDNVQQHQFAEACGAQSVGKWVVSTLVKQPKAYPCTKLSEGTKLGREKMRVALEMIASIGEPAVDSSAAQVLAQCVAAAREALA